MWTTPLGVQPSMHNCQHYGDAYFRLFRTRWEKHLEVADAGLGNEHGHLPKADISIRHDGSSIEHPRRIIREFEKQAIADGMETKELMKRKAASAANFPTCTSTQSCLRAFGNSPLCTKRRRLVATSLSR